METVTISSKYQVVIPRQIREQFKLKPGQKLIFVAYENSLRVVVIPPIEAMRGRYPDLDTRVEREDEERV